MDYGCAVDCAEASTSKPTRMRLRHREGAVLFSERQTSDGVTS